MHDPVRHPAFLGASQQVARSVALSVGGDASGGLWRRSGIVLVAVALLGAASAVREFDISIRDHRVEGGAATLRVNRGDTVLLRCRSNQALSLHVHGYDLGADLFAASAKTIRFEATVAGRFPITAHEFGAGDDQHARSKKHREVTLLYLEVLPE